MGGRTWPWPAVDVARREGVGVGGVPRIGGALYGASLLLAAY